MRCPTFTSCFEPAQRLGSVGAGREFIAVNPTTSMFVRSVVSLKAKGREGPDHGKK